MSWRPLTVPVTCWFCKAVIQPGRQARFGDRTPAVWCEGCALSGLDEVPPDDAAELPAPPAAAAKPDPQPNLFGEDLAGQYKSADARAFLERLRGHINKLAGERERKQGPS